VNSCAGGWRWFECIARKTGWMATLWRPRFRSGTELAGTAHLEPADQTKLYNILTPDRQSGIAWGRRAALCGANAESNEDEDPPAEFHQSSAT